MNTYLLRVLNIVFCSILGFSQLKATESFKDPEVNFNLAIQKILDKHLDKSITKEALFQAATRGVLQSLNSEDEKWNKLLTPKELKEMEVDLSGKVIGIGASIKFDEYTGYGWILKSIPGSPAEKAGLKSDDQILSVDGKKFKGKKLQDLINAIRGETGKSVELRVLREDKILTLNIKREVVPWTPVELEKVDSSTALLTIGFFNEQTPKLVKESLQKINKEGFKKIIVDVRDNNGGSFEQVVKIIDFFLPSNSIIASTINRDGQSEKFKSHNEILNRDIQIIVLTNKETFSGAELFVASLRENKKIKVVGETTYGKWNAQIIEILPNQFALQYTIKKFLSPLGNSFQGVGVKPDLEVLLPKEVDLKELRTKFELSRRLSVDLQLKAALEFLKSS